MACKHSVDGAPSHNWASPLVESSLRIHSYAMAYVVMLYVFMADDVTRIVKACMVMAYGLCSYELCSYGPYGHGLRSHGLHGYGLHIYGLCVCVWPV